MNNRKLILIGAGVFTAMLIIGIIALITQSSNNSPTGNNDLYVDPGSGEIVSNDSGLSQSAIDDPNQRTITFLGFSFLIERGMSRDQSEAVQQAISEYSSSLSNRFTEVSLIKDSARYGSEPGDSTKELQFDIRANRSDLYYVTLTYSDLNSVIVKLYETDKETLLFTTK